MASKSLAQRLLPLTSPFDETFSTIVDALCPETLFARSVVIGFVSSIKASEEPLQTPNEPKAINGLLSEIIRERLWRFATFRILQRDDIQIGEINQQMIMARCYDLLHVVVLLEECFRVPDDSKETAYGSAAVPDRVRSSWQRID